KWRWKFSMPTVGQKMQSPTRISACYPLDHDIFNQVLLQGTALEKDPPDWRVFCLSAVVFHQLAYQGEHLIPFFLEEVQGHIVQFQVIRSLAVWLFGAPGLVVLRLGHRLSLEFVVIAFHRNILPN